MTVSRAIILNDEQGGTLTVSRKDDLIQFEVSGLVWASEADIRKFAAELLGAYPAEQQERVGG